MGAFGMLVMGKTAWTAVSDAQPEPLTMGAVALLALAVNLEVALMLYAFRDGDANMRSVWLCSRNDALGNIAVMLAAAGVLGTGSGWLDLLVALVMAGLALSAGTSVVRQARLEIAHSGQAVAISSHLQDVGHKSLPGITEVSIIASK